MQQVREGRGRDGQEKGKRIKRKVSSEVTESKIVAVISDAM